MIIGHANLGVRFKFLESTRTDYHNIKEDASVRWVCFNDGPHNGMPDRESSRRVGHVVRVVLLHHLRAVSSDS